MAFSTEELASISNSALDYYFERGKLFQQAIQSKPLLARMESSAKSFPGGKGDISLAVKGDYGMPVDDTGTPAPVPPSGGSDAVTGYTHDDSVAFYTPANVRRANYPWREHHIGLTMTHTELKIDGISVTDTNGKNTSNHSRREMTVLVNLLEDKLQDLGEQYARGMNGLLWGDGAADAKALAGIQSIITDDPTTGTVGGIDRSVFAWWRNLSLAGGNALTPDPSAQVIGVALSNLYRQLRRYGGKPSLMLCGSDFLEACETEFRQNGYYTDNGFSRGADMSAGDMKFKGITMQYDPSLDDAGMAKKMYWIDTSAIFLMKMENEWRKNHTPARPADQFVLYRSITSTGQLVAKQCNSSAVVEIA